MFDKRENLITVNTSIYALMMLKASISREIPKDASDPMDSLFNLMADITLADLCKEACGKTFTMPCEASVDPRATNLRNFEVPEGFAMWLTVGADKVARAIEENPAYSPGATEIICRQIAQIAFPLMDAVPSSREQHEEILGGPEMVQIVRQEAQAFITSKEFIGIGKEVMGNKAPPITPPAPSDIPDELPSDEELFGNNE